MTDTTGDISRRWVLTPLIIAGALGLAIVLGLLALSRLERVFVEEVRERNEASLRLAVEALNGALNRFEALPALIAERPILAALLEDPGNTQLQDAVSAQFLIDLQAFGASDVYVMDRAGTTVAASSYKKERSFVGRSFAYRPYFTQARAGGLGRFFALGTTSNERGYFFAAPVRQGDDILGVVAVKFMVNEFEAAWQGGESDLLVSDENDVIFMSNRPDWHFRTLSPTSEAARAEIEANRQYPLDALRPLGQTVSTRWGGMQVVTIEPQTSPLLFSEAPVPETGLQVSILTPVGPALTQARLTLAAILLVLLLIGLIALVIKQRRLRLLERLEVQRQQRDLLEGRVAERTADLNDANRQLLAEVQERRMAETRLRETQTELIQAGKLAALGQMSAALSHEFNQPLAAVKSYSENAAAFLDRNKLPQARENMGRISDMADRMAEISRHLRNFARRPQEQVGAIPLNAALDDALALMESRLGRENATLIDDIPDGEVQVIGGRVRLQQVIVNLLSNALDAMADQAEKRIDLSVEEDAQEVRVVVRDRGPGLGPDVLEKAFDPFFTTKGPGKGLGLGLSISFNIIRDFGGRLEAANHPEGGAVFTIVLRPAPAA